MTIRQETTAAVLAAAILALIAGCISDNPACDALPTEISLSLTAGWLTPSDPAVCRDREVTLRVSSEVDGLLHIHGYDEQIPATTVTAGEVADLSFTATSSGQFPIELHTDESAQGLSVGVFTVHEP